MRVRTPIPALPRWLPFACAAGLALTVAFVAGAQPLPNQPQFAPFQPPFVAPQPTPFPFFALFPAWIMPIVVVVVAAQQQLLAEEEDGVSHMQAGDTGAFEYKIIRSAMGAFKHPAKFKAALEGEAAAGWELFEKFDCSRARLRRPVSCRQRDAELAQDPYRTNVGVGQGAIAAWIILGVLVAIGLVVGILVLALK